jgi:DNA-binding transcriptional MerR regulator
VDELTVEDLAREAGVPVSTVRLYQARGLLPAPERRGRVAYYGFGHLARMHLIGRLQEDGFSLASIRHLVDAWEEGRGLTELLGLEERVAGWDRQPVKMSPAELAALLPGAELSPDVLTRARQLGLVDVADDGTLTVPDMELLRVGSDLMHLGVPTAEVLDEYEALLQTVRPVTERFVALFERHFLAPVEAEGFTPDGVRRLTDTLDRLRNLSTRVVAAAMRQAFAEAASAKLAELALLGAQDLGDVHAGHPPAGNAGDDPHAD